MVVFGDLWSFVVVCMVCGGLQWFAVVCLIVIPPAPVRRLSISAAVDDGRLEIDMFLTCFLHYLLFSEHY